MTKKTSYVDPISQYFLNHVVPVENTPIGQAYAKAMMQDLRNTFPNEDNQVLAKFLFSWNNKSTKPFPSDFILNSLKIEPQKIQRGQKPDPETFATRLFDDPDDKRR